MKLAGLGRIESSSLTVTVWFDRFADWWEPFTLGVGQAGAHVARLAPDRREGLRARCEELLPAPPFPIQCVSLERARACVAGLSVVTSSMSGSGWRDPGGFTMADADDVRRLALALPEVEEIACDGFDFRVGGKGFIWSYPERRPGRPRVLRTDIAVVFVGDEAEKQALLAR